MEKDCPVCLIPHDAETHRATLDLKKWYRSQILAPPAVPPKKVKEVLNEGSK